MRFDVTFRELDKKLDVDFCPRNEQIKADLEHFQTVSDHTGVEYYKGRIHSHAKNRKTRACDTPKVSGRKCKNQRNSIFRGVKS